MENSWLFFTLNVYSPSVKRQQIAPKKVYSIDTGMGNAVGFSFSPNTGKWLENAVFLALRRKTQDIYYCATPRGYEVDFFHPETRQLIQVCQDTGNQNVRTREFRALEDEIQEMKPTSALILSDVNEPTSTLHGVPVSVRSVAEWLLSQ